MGQLVSATGPWGIADYGYDSLGNVRFRDYTDFGGSGRNISLIYDSRNRVSSSIDSRPASLGGTGTRTVAYDNRGNVTSLGNLAMVYDMSDQPTLISGTADGTGAANGHYRYDGNLRRVKSVVNGATIYNVYDAAGSLIYIDDLGGSTAQTSYVSGPSGTFARIKRRYVTNLNSQGNPGGYIYDPARKQYYTDDVTYLHNDHLGSALAGTDSSGAIAFRERYTPFGLTLDAPAANDNLAGFTGHIKDKATGLNYMQARYYDPVMGRFLSIDPVTFMDSGHPGMFNRYAYTFNDPINLIDPFGEAPGDPFDSITEAAKDWSNYVQSNEGVDRSGDPIDIDSSEYGSVISQTTNENGDTSYSYNQPRKGTADNVPFGGTKTELDNAVGSIHNHNASGTVSADEADRLGAPSTNRASGRRGLDARNGVNGNDDRSASNALSNRSNVSDRRTFRTEILGPKQRLSGASGRKLRSFKFRGSRAVEVK